MNIISLILILIAGIFNSCMDVLRYRFNTSIFRFWPNQTWIDPTLSWQNKWNFKNKFIRLIMSTSLVWLTDFWHLCKMLMLTSIMFSIVFYNIIFNWWIDLILLYLAFTITFEIFFKIVLIKK